MVMIISVLKILGPIWLRFNFGQSLKSFQLEALEKYQPTILHKEVYFLFFEFLEVKKTPARGCFTSDLNLNQIFKAVIQTTLLIAKEAYHYIPKCKAPNRIQETYKTPARKKCISNILSMGPINPKPISYNK